MSDKKIIIDGIDVSKCQHYGKCSTYCYVVDELCSDNPNCYYKQLARKEQELQEAMDNYVQLDLQRVKEYNELVDLYKSKEQEYEKLKEELEQIKLLLNNGEIELVNRLLRYNRAINAIEELAKNNDKVNSKEIQKIIKRIEQ